MDKKIGWLPATCPPWIGASRDHLDLTERTAQDLVLKIPAAAWEESLFLVADVYAAANHVHPEGHVGWWKFDLDDSGTVKLKVAKDRHGIRVLRTRAGKAPSCWINPDAPAISRQPVLALHLVLRNARTQAIVFDEALLTYTDPAALATGLEQRAAFASQLKASGGAAAVPRYCWPRETQVHLVTTNFAAHDAIGKMIMGTSRLFAGSNVPCAIYARVFDPVLRGVVRPLSALPEAVGKDDLILFNFSTFDPYMEMIAALPCRKMLYFHNITPPQFIRAYDAEGALNCARGLEQLPLARKFDVVAANSNFSAAVLRDALANGEPVAPKDPADVPANQPSIVEAGRVGKACSSASRVAAGNSSPVLVFPPMTGLQAWRDLPEEPMELPSHGTILLYVGRMAPHKKIEDLLGLLDACAHLDKDSCLLVVGARTFPAYWGYIQQLLDTTYKHLRPNFLWIEHATEGQLKTIYRRSSAFVTMSEHEGFCVPLVEAMHFGKPVFAYAHPAVCETLGDSGRVFHAKDFKMIASNILAVMRDDALRERVLTAQNARLGEIISKIDGHGLWGAAERALFRDAHTT